MFTNYETTCIGQVHGYFGITSEITVEKFPMVFLAF